MEDEGTMVPVGKALAGPEAEGVSSDHALSTRDIWHGLSSSPSMAADYGT